MIIDVAHTKGGVGKTTVATNIAIGLGANIVDLDVVKATQAFGALREQQGKSFPVYTAETMNKEKAVDMYKGSPDKHLVIDSGGYDSSVIRRFLGISDLIITPLSGSAVEITGIMNFDENIISKILPVVKIPTFVLLNRIPYHDRGEAAELREYIENDMDDFGVLKSMLSDRKAYRQAYASGLSVLELPKNKAADEIRDLLSEIKNILGTEAHK